MKTAEPLKQILSCGYRLYFALTFLAMSAPLLPEGRGQPASPTISSVRYTTNGLALSWSSEGSNTVYTVQFRDSLSSGAWQNASMRYRWPWPFTTWSDAALTLRAPRFYRVTAETLPPPERGKLLTNSWGSFSTNFVSAELRSWGFLDFVTPKFAINKARLTYETVDPFGLPIRASALLVVPRGVSRPLPLISIQPGGLSRTNEVASLSKDNWDYIVALAFATLGYVAIVPDFIGLGDSPGYQANGHAQTEATTVIDALRAARTICANNQVTLNEQLFLFGASLGGHASMAAHRELETFHSNEFTVTASAPCSGAYDLGGVSVDWLLTQPSNSRPWFPVRLASYLPIYRLGDTLEELLAEPYRRTLPPLLNGAHTLAQIRQAMPADMFKILRANFEADFRTNANNSLRAALRDNNVYAWTPRAPITLFHCGGDRTVPFANAEVAYQSFTNRGACCVQLVDPGLPQQLDHGFCNYPSLRAALTWFETFKQ